MISKNDHNFEYDKNQFPKTPEHFKQLVTSQVETELNKEKIVAHNTQKKWWPAKVAAAAIICAAVGTSGVYAGVQHHYKSQEILQEYGRITPHTEQSDTTSESGSSSSNNSSDSAPATTISDQNGLRTSFSDTWPDVMLDNYKEHGFEFKGESNPYLTIQDVYYDGGILSVYGEATPYGLRKSGKWFLPDHVVIDDTIYTAQWDIGGTNSSSQRGTFFARVELSDADLPEQFTVQLPFITLMDPKTGYHYIQTISFDISGESIVKNSVTTTTTDGIPVTIGKVKVSASGTYLDLIWNFGQDKNSYQKFEQVMNDDNIHNWIFCKVTDSNGNTYDTQTSNAAFHSALSDNTGGESAFIGDDGNYYFQTQVVIPDMTQDFTSLEVTPYIHLEDGSETDLDFASFQVDYE